MSPAAIASRWRREALSLWGAPAQGLGRFSAWSFDTGELRLHVARGPRSGPPLLLMPGLADPWFSYRGVLPPLSRRFTVYVVDHRGHGPSGRPADGRFRVVDYARDVTSLLRDGIGKPSFVAGNSLGALLAAHLAVRQPDLVLGCVLEDGPFFITEPRRWRRSPLRTGLFADPARRLEQAERNGTGEAAFVRTWRDRRWGFAPRGPLPQRAIFLAKFLAVLKPLWPSLSGRERRRLTRGYCALVEGRPVRLGDVFPDAWIAEAARIAYRVASGCPRAATRVDFSAGFDHAATLCAVRCPTVVLEADRDLVGLLPRADMMKLMACLKAARGVHRLCDGALHAIHQSHPAVYVEAVCGLLLDRP